jgi:hypothetical protein
MSTAHEMFNVCTLAVDQATSVRVQKRIDRTDLELRALRLMTRIRRFDDRAGWHRGRIVGRNSKHNAERSVRFKLIADRAAAQLQRTLQAMRGQS